MLGLVLGLALALGAVTAVQATETQPAPCPTARANAPLEPPPTPPMPTAEPETGGADYRHLLKPTAAGWPVRDHWCIWVEPVAAEAGTAAAVRDQQWQRAVAAALHSWSTLLSLTEVSSPEQAQIRLWRRRPPLQPLADGRNRASNGRAVLHLLLVDRGSGWQAEPDVEVLLSPGRPERAMQATALHELGHAFGLWAHSDRPNDAMAATPGGVPVLELSPRDRGTLQWLLRQSGRLQTPPGPVQTPAAAPEPPQAPKAD